MWGPDDGLQQTTSVMTPLMLCLICIPCTTIKLNPQTIKYKDKRSIGHTGPVG